MKSFEQTIYLNREKEENWDIVDQAEELGFTNAQDLLYLGYDIEMNVEICEQDDISGPFSKILSINGVDVSHLNILI